MEGLVPPACQYMKVLFFLPGAPGRALERFEQVYYGATKLTCYFSKFVEKESALILLTVQIQFIPHSNYLRISNAIWNFHGLAMLDWMWWSE